MTTVPARDTEEAQRGLNDIFPGDPYPVLSLLTEIRQRSVQAIGAGISRRDWHATETAYNELRDRTDDLIARLAAEHPSKPMLVEAIKASISHLEDNSEDKAYRILKVALANTYK